MRDIPVQLGAERERDGVHLAGRIDEEISRSADRWRIEGRQVERGQLDRRTDLGPGGDHLALGDRMGRARDRRVEEGLEVHAVQRLPALHGSAPEGPLSDLGLGQQDRPRQQRERMGDQPSFWCQQSVAGVERGLEDLLLEWLVADDLGDQQVGTLRQFDLPRPAGYERHTIPNPVEHEHALCHVGDVAGLDRVDVPGTGPGRGDGEDPAAGADVEHYVRGAHRCRQGGQVVACPSFIVEHARVLHRIGPPTGRGSIGVRSDQCTLLDQHVEDAQRRRKISGMAVLALQPVDRVAKPDRLREHGQDREAPRSDVDDGPHR